MDIWNNTRIHFVDDTENFSNACVTHNKTDIDCNGLRQCFYTKVDDYAVGAYFILLSILGTILNPLTICITVFGKHLSRTVKPHLINLAVVDLVISIFTPPIILIQNLNVQVPWTTALCKAAAVLHLVPIHVNLICNAFISLERFFIVYFPLKATLYRQKHRYMIITFAWLCGVLPEIETFLYSHVEQNEGLFYCVMFSESALTKADVWAHLKFWIPAGTIIISYTLIVIKLAIRKQGELQQNASRDNIRPIAKLQTMLMADAFLTVLTGLPISFATMLKIFHPEIFEMATPRGAFVIRIVVLSFAAINACSSSITCYIFNHHFRSDTRLLFERLCGNKYKINQDVRVNVESLTPETQKDSGTTS